MKPILFFLLIFVSYVFLRWLSFNRVFRFLRRRVNQPRLPRRSPWFSFGGGGGNDDDPGPPPPYSRYPPPPRKTYQVPPETRGWTPGFWTGLASGATAGYGLGSARRSATERPRHYTSTNTENPAPRTSGWFGGNTGGQSHSPSYSSSNRRDNEDSKSGTHTSTGFGGTRRR